MSQKDGRHHLVPLLPSAPNDWSVWRWACLRGAGFPVSRIMQLAASDTAAIADELARGEDAATQSLRALLEALRGDHGERPHEVLVALRRARKRVEKGKLPAEGDVVGVAEEELATARAASAHVEELRAAYARAFDASRRRVSQAIRETANDPRFREALTWQNRTVIESALAALLRRGEGDDGGSQQRQHEELVASYLQRYCAKNDTIGFFGPVGWARVTTSSDVITFAPGRSLLAARNVYFEQWPIDALARKLRETLPLEPWLTPRRLPFVHVDGAVAMSTMNGRHELSPLELALVTESDARTTARELAARAVAASLAASEADVFAALRALAEKKLVAFDLEVPLGWMPERTLRAALERIPDEAIRTAALAPLDELVVARDRVQRSAGTPKELAAALADLDATFTRLTGLPATRHAGLMYAGRQVVFEDCRRDADLALGAGFLEENGPALELFLTSARWMTFETAKLYRAALYAVYEDLAKRRGSRAVPFTDVWIRAQRLFHGGADRPIERVVAELTERWSKILGELPADARQMSFRSEDLRARVHEVFDAPAAGWHAARSHSPDLMIAASSVEAIARGDYLVLLGEMHVAVNTLATMVFAAQHPQKPELDEAFSRDNEASFVSPVPSKDWPRVTVRATLTSLPAGGRYLETGLDPAPGDRDHVLMQADLVVEEIDGKVVVRHGDLVIELLEFFGEILTTLTASEFRLLPRRDHMPRITVDRVVAARESWSFMPSALEFAFEMAPEVRFARARRWAKEHGIPRYFFAKTAIEVKPTFIDLDSPLLVAAFAKLVRAAENQATGPVPISMTEMLPRLDETWLTDADGERYTSELRFVAVDERG